MHLLSLQHIDYTASREGYGDEGTLPQGTRLELEAMI